MWDVRSSVSRNLLDLLPLPTQIAHAGQTAAKRELGVLPVAGPRRAN